MLHAVRISMLVSGLAACALAAQPSVFPLPTPDQTVGAPYSKSGPEVALSAIKQHLVVFAGSRYGYALGKRIRLDDGDPLHCQALVTDGIIYVPASFAALVGLGQVAADTPYPGLEKRWVYTVPRPAFQPTADLRTITHRNATWYALVDVAKRKGLIVSQDGRGLCAVGVTAFDIAALPEEHHDSVIALFDTPESLADPEIATKYIPTLAYQGRWQDHAKATPEALAAYAKPETEWPVVPDSAYDLSHFDATLLGSKPPAPGVYPRLLFSPEDLPAIRSRIESSAVGRYDLMVIEELFRQSWWDPATSDGKAFRRLIEGRLTVADVLGEDGQVKTPFNLAGQKAGIFNTHCNYITNCLSTMSFWCLVKGDEVRGTEAATAIANWAAFIMAPQVDLMLTRSDSEMGVAPGPAHLTSTSFRPTVGIFGFDGPFLLDFAGKWMTEDQRKVLQDAMTKAIYGRRDAHQCGPLRWRENNHASWHTGNFLMAMALEGLPGVDPELLPEAKQHVRAFLDWGIDPQGQIFESNGKSGGGLRFQELTMIALARRGVNLFGHPHLQKLLEAQVQCTSPTGRVTASSGTFSGSPLATQFVASMKAYFPGDRNADYLLTLGYPEIDPPHLDLDGLRQKVRDHKIPALRLPGPTYPGWVRTVLFDRDWVKTTREEVKPALTWVTPVHGVLSASSDTTDQAAWLNFQVRPNQYYGAGHHHNDSGMIHFSALGVDWLTESRFSSSYAGNLHNQPLVDGRASSADAWSAPGTWVGATTSPQTAFATCDLTYAYSWRWMTQVGQWRSGEDWTKLPWELDAEHPNAVAAFAGTQHCKMRPWWPSFAFSNWCPVLRAPDNTMRFVFRSAGLVRGAHPYAVVVDDLRKDDGTHSYQFAGMLAKGVWRAELSGLPTTWAALASLPQVPKAKDEGNRERPALKPLPGEPVLLVIPLSDGSAAVDVAQDGPLDKKTGQRESHDRIVVTQQANEGRLRVALVPWIAGRALPQVDSTANAAHIRWGDAGEDRLTFTIGAEQRTRLTINRDGQALGATP